VSSREGNPIISTVNLTKVYPQTKMQALKEVNIAIHAGELVGIKGPSGSGKSTFLHLIAGLISPTSGSIYFKGRPLAAMRDKSLYRRENIGYIFQDFYLYPGLNVLENLLLPLSHRLFVGGSSRRRAMEILAQLDMVDKARRDISTLSAGERQRVCIARALLNEPELMLADEPTGSLDTKNAEVILRLLQEINEARGTTIIIVTHEDRVARFTQRTIEMVDGQVV